MPPTAGPSTASDAEARQLWSETHDAYQRRDYSGAAELIQRLLLEHGEGAGGASPAAARLLFGIILLRLRRTEEGVVELLRSVELDPEVGRAHYKLGLGLGRLGRNAEAMAHFQRAVTLAPDIADHQWRLAEELRRQGRPGAASKALRRCLQLQSDHAEALDTQAALRKTKPLARIARRFGLARR